MQRRIVRTLIQSRQWEALQKMGQEMLATEGLSLVDQAVAHIALCVADSFWGQHGPAVGAGEVAVFLAKQSGDADLLGEALYYSGIAYGRTRWHQRAFEQFEEFTRHLDEYVEAKAMYPKVLLNQGIGCRWMHDNERAADKMAQAWSLTENKSSPEAQPIRRNYVWHSMLAHRLDAVPDLLALGRRYVEEHPDDHLARYHQINDEARYALLMGDHDTAYRLAASVIQEAEAYPHLQAESGLTIHYLAVAEGLHKDALAVGCLVKVKAAKARREDLDTEVTRSISEIDQAHDGMLMRELLVEMGQIRAPSVRRPHGR